MKDIKIVKKIFEEGKPYDTSGAPYRKPLTKFAKFGTSGIRWLVRGSLAMFDKNNPERARYYRSNGYTQEDFIMPNAGMIIKAIAMYNLRNAEKEKVSNKGLVVIYDNRPGNSEFAHEAAKILAAYGIKATLSKTDGAYVPTPLAAASLLVKNEGYAGSIMFTASHNGDEWNGIKFEGSSGAAASPEVTNVIGALLAEEFIAPKPGYDIAEESIEELIHKNMVETKDITGYYINAILDYIGDTGKSAIKKAILEKKVEFFYSAFYGSSALAAEKLCKELGLPAKNVIETRKPSKDIYVESYEPTMAKLTKLVASVKAAGDAAKANNEDKIVLGGAADNDADRFQVNQYDPATGAVEEFGPDKLSAVLGHYLCKYKGFKGPFGRSFVSATLQDYVAKLFGDYEPIETATGFKFSPKIFKEGGVLFVEESYGISFKNWTLDKDGILPSILALELVSVTGKSLEEYYTGEVLGDLKKRGLPAEIYFKRFDMKLAAEEKAEAINRFTAFFNAIITGKTVFAGHTVSKRYDPKEFDGGMKFVLDDGSWIAFRSSGTEPVIRLYVEARSEQDKESLRKAALALMKV